jgi:hypothetical protein
MRLKNIKLFEEFENNSKKDFLSKSGLLDIIYDLKELSLEYLDVRHINNDENKSILDKNLIFNVELYNKNDDFECHLFGGNFSFDEPNIEENLHWETNVFNGVFSGTEKEILEGLKSNSLVLSITFSIIIGEYGDAEIIDDDTSKVFNVISEMYPNIKFDTINPWDL